MVTEASRLRSVVLLSESFPDEKERIRSLLSQHIDDAVNEEWPEMSRQRATLTRLPVKLIEAMQTTLALKPVDEGQTTAQREMIGALENAFEARRQRILISQSSVSKIKWAGLLLQALCTLVAIAMVHVDHRGACAIGLALFATGVAMSILLIGCYSRPFTGEISIGPELLQQAITSDAEPGVND